MRFQEEYRLIAKCLNFLHDKFDDDIQRDPLICPRGEYVDSNGFTSK